MKKLDWKIKLCIALIALSALFYTIHFLIFRDMHHIFIYLLGDIAFVFLEVLLVTMILHRLLKNQEKRVKVRKLNMLVGAFFNKVGTNLLRKLLIFDCEREKTSQNLLVKVDWNYKNFYKMRNYFKKCTLFIDTQRGDLINLRDYLSRNHDYIIRILENPHIMEHESFTDMLWAVCHVCDELEYRNNLEKLSEEDAAHLAGDISRAYSHIITEWLMYMKNLQIDYPYLFSLACRINPFDPNAKAEIV